MDGGNCPKFIMEVSGVKIFVQDYGKNGFRFTCQTRDPSRTAGSKGHFPDEPAAIEGALEHIAWMLSYYKTSTF